MRTELRPRAVMRVEGGFAHICAWCSDKPDADAWAEARGLQPSHGLCPACQPKLASEVIFEAGERCAAPEEQSFAAASAPFGAPSCLVAFSCRMGGGRP